ncbi:MAG: hypothetical protein U0525_02405 [Patescibacteria group bacterium]
MNNKDKIASFFVRQQFVIVLEKWAIPMLSIMLTVFLVYESYVTYGIYNEYLLKREELAGISNSLDKYKRNIILNDEDKNYYGAILAKQIPAKENIFATYTFVDDFIAKSGLDITQYGEANVPLPESPGVNSLNISVSGLVSKDRFYEFLNEYKYKYSRFMIMTNMNKEVLESVTDTDANINFTTSLSLYTIPSVTTIGDDLHNLNLISFDKLMKSKFDDIKSKLNDDNYTEKQESEEDIPVDYDPVNSLF